MNNSGSIRIRVRSNGNTGKWRGTTLHQTVMGEPHLRWHARQATEPAIGSTKRAGGLCLGTQVDTNSMMRTSTIPTPARTAPLHPATGRMILGLGRPTNEDDEGEVMHVEGHPDSDCRCHGVGELKRGNARG